MHLKCIHELCTIIVIFHSYLHHIRGISLFYIDFRDNSQFSHLFGTNPAEPENPFSMFLTFRDPTDVQMSYKFTGVIILEGEDLGAKEVNDWRPEDQKGGVPRGYSTRPRGPIPIGPRGPVCMDPSPRSILVT